MVEFSDLVESGATTNFIDIKSTETKIAYSSSRKPNEVKLIDGQLLRAGLILQHIGSFAVDNPKSH